MFYNFDKNIIVFTPQRRQKLFIVVFNEFETLGLLCFVTVMGNNCEFVLLSRLFAHDFDVVLVNLINKLSKNLIN